MNSLKVPENGLQLEGSSSDPDVPAQAFAVSLDDNVIEDMIQCVQGGGDIQLALGPNPTFHVGSHSHTIEPPSTNYPFDIFLTKPYENSRRADRIAQAGSLFLKPFYASSKKTASKSSNAESKWQQRDISPTASDPGTEALQRGLADADAKKQQTRLAGNLLPNNKKAASKAKGKLLAAAYASSTTPRSMPASPALSSVGSPQTPVLSASQQQLERIKEQRVTLVHELAVQDRSLQYLERRWPGKEEDLRPTLEKVADCIDDKWSLRKKNWKELDVWSYDYASQEIRQKAIDNAIRHFDKQRLSAREPEWQKLLPKEDRGKGICLSRLQANLARGPQSATPKYKKSDGGSTPKDESSVDGDRPKAASQPMSRTGSNGLPAKPKKASGQDAQVKRLLGNNKSKAAAPKTSPAKARGGAKGDRRILSQEFIENSDSSGDEPVMVKPKAVAKPLAKSRDSEVKDTVVAKPRPVATKESSVKKQQQQQQPTQPMKRPREDDDSSSSSNTPLAKKAKPRQPLTAPRPLKQRPVDTAQSRVNGSTAPPVKSKNTSPVKSSPLASSPPTNASDLDSETPPAPAPKKRKAETEGKAMPVKRPATSRDISNDLVSKAQKFKLFYSKYEALHYEILELDDPPETKLDDLKDMRRRLMAMKREIYDACPPERH